MRKQKFVLPITPTSEAPAGTICFKQFDNEVGGIIADVQGLEAPLSDELLRLDCKKPDGKVVSVNGVLDSAGHIVFDVIEQMTVIPGTVLCEVVFSDVTNKIGSANFNIKVIPAVIQLDDDDSETALPAFLEIVHRAEAAMAESEVQARNAADSASLSSDYADDSKAHADDAAEEATKAANSASTATSKATAAANSASTATSKATAAANSATDAARSAQNALESKNAIIDDAGQTLNALVTDASADLNTVIQNARQQLSDAADDAVTDAVTEFNNYVDERTDELINQLRQELTDLNYVTSTSLKTTNDISYS